MVRVGGSPRFASTLDRTSPRGHARALRAWVSARARDRCRRHWIARKVQPLRRHEGAANTGRLLPRNQDERAIGRPAREPTHRQLRTAASREWRRPHRGSSRPSTVEGSPMRPVRFVRRPSRTKCGVMRRSRKDHSLFRLMHLIVSCPLCSSADVRAIGRGPSGESACVASLGRFAGAWFRAWHVDFGARHSGSADGVGALSTRAWRWGARGAAHSVRPPTPRR